MVRILKTASFRLGAAYACLFALSVLVLGTVVFYVTRSALLQQSHDRIAAEAALLAADTRHRSLGVLASIVERRSHAVGGLDYLVLNSKGRKLAGDLPRALAIPGWSTTDIPSTIGDGDYDDGAKTVRVFAQTFPDGSLLAVGADISNIEETSQAVMTAFGWAIVVTIGLGLLGGIALSAAFLKRVDTVSRTAEAIIDGDLARRIPLRGTDDDFDRLANSLNRMLDRIGDLMASLKQVSSDIAHDMRTPLSRLRQRLDTARRSARSVEDYGVAVDGAIRDVDAILETFGALLRIAQIEAGTRRAGFKDIDLDAIVATVLDAFAPTAEDEGKALVAVSAAPAVIRGDRELVTQMLVNLAENAIRHTPIGTHIMIATRAGPSGTDLVVEDDGPGIPQDEWRKVSRPFYRLDRSRSTAGSGLGLALVQAIADLHGAHVIFADAGPGLSVCVNFPQQA